MSGPDLGALKNGMDAAITYLRAVTNDSININTPGYKASNVEFATGYSQLISSGTEHINPQSRIGGAIVASISRDWSDGSLGPGTEMDVSIVGDGFFILGDNSTQLNPDGDLVYATVGLFQTDASGEYVTSQNGQPVFGYELNSSGQRVSDTLVPLQTNGNSDIGFVEGGILVSDFSGSQTPMYQLAITDFANRDGLIYMSGSVFRATAASGPHQDPGISATGDYGEATPEVVEGSNVTVPTLALKGTLLQRHFSALQGSIDYANKTYTQTISKLMG